MLYPTLEEINTSRDLIDAFRGYDHNLRISENSFYDMKNMTSNHYPILSPRGKRGRYLFPTNYIVVKENGVEDDEENNTITDHNIQGMVAKDSLCYVDGRDFIINNYKIMGLELSDEPKNLISMGAYVIIMPDKKWVNTENQKFGNIENRYEPEEVSHTSFELCKIDGSSYGNVEKGEEYPNGLKVPVDPKDPNGDKEPPDKAFWIDTSSVPHSLKQWSKSSSMWVPIATTYIKISSRGIAAGFEKYDGVVISGLKDTPLTDTFGNAIENKKDLEAIDGSFVIWDKHESEDGDDDYIVIVGMLDEVRTIKQAIKVTRTMPEMDFIIESRNRLWGCKYGAARNGDIVNEIYACKLGDFKNWDCFMGISTDSYVASCGTDGKFTGAITFQGYPIFFKEECFHKVYGNLPSDFQIQDTACKGVQYKSDKSLAIVNNILYYKARSGICAYDGSLPVEISSVFGDIAYSDAVAGGIGNKYYVSMKDQSGKYNLFVYDTAKGMWHKEDDLKVEQFCSCRGELYYIDATGSEVIGTMLGSGVPNDDSVQWMAESGVIGTSSPDKKYVSRLTIRMSLEIGARVDIYAEYNSSGQWEKLFTMVGRSLKTFAVPVRPKRSDHFRLRITGEGNAKIYSIAKTIEEGSDV